MAAQHSSVVGRAGAYFALHYMRRQHTTHCCSHCCIRHTEFNANPQSCWQRKHTFQNLLVAYKHSYVKEQLCAFVSRFDLRLLVRRRCRIPVKRGTLVLTCKRLTPVHVIQVKLVPQHVETRLQNITLSLYLTARKLIDELVITYELSDHRLCNWVQQRVRIVHVLCSCCDRYGRLVCGLLRLTTATLYTHYIGISATTHCFRKLFCA